MSDYAMNYSVEDINHCIEFIKELEDRAYGYHINHETMGYDTTEFETNCAMIVDMLKDLRGC